MDLHEYSRLTQEYLKIYHNLIVKSNQFICIKYVIYYDIYLKTL